MKVVERDVVQISYMDLCSIRNDDYNNDNNSSSAAEFRVMLEKIHGAFGSDDDCLGIIAITDIPMFAELREKLLPLSHQLACNLPAKDLDEVTVESACYSVGWSCGKEKVEGDKYDTSKGSFYANPITDNLLQSTLQRQQQQNNNHDDNHPFLPLPCSDKELIQTANENPAFFAPNVWPTHSLPDLEPTFKDMGMLIWKVGVLVAKLCDYYVSIKCPGFIQGKLESIIRYSLCCKGRLLHYFPKEAIMKNKQNHNHQDVDFSDWCGWHNDHGSLTGLVPAMFLDKDGNQVECPDPTAGLYIKSRNGMLVHVKLPPNALAFQVGETTQVHTGGILQATPHAVKGCQIQLVDSNDTINNTFISRESFAVFMEPEFYGDMDIPDGRTLQDTQRQEAEIFLPKNVRTLRSRWEHGMNFGEFSNATFSAFY